MSEPTHAGPAISSPAEPMLAWTDRYRGWLFAALGVVYALGWTTRWHAGPDSALYMVLGRNLLNGEGYRYAGEAHGFVHPMLPWLLAGLWRVTGVSIAAANVMAWLCVVGALGLWYRVLVMRFDRRRAVWMVVLLGVMLVVFRYAFQILTEPVFFLGVTVVVYAYERMRAEGGAAWRWASVLLLGAGLFVVAAARPTMWALVGAVLLAGVWHTIVGPRRWLHAAMAAMAVISVGLFRGLDPRRAAGGSGGSGSGGGYESGAVSMLTDPGELIHNAVTRFWPEWFHPHACEAMLSIELGPPLNWVMGLAALAIGVWAFRWRVLWGLLFVLTVGGLMTYRPEVRYLMPLAPLWAVGWTLVVVGLLRTRRAWMHWAAVGLLLLWIVPNVARDVDFILDQHRQPFLVHHADGAFAPIAGLAEQVADTLEPDAAVIGPREPIVSWYWRRPAASVDGLASGRRRAIDRIERYTAEGRALYLLTPAPDAAIAQLKAMHYALGPQVAHLSSTDPHHPPAALHRLVRRTEQHVE